MPTAQFHSIQPKRWYWPGLHRGTAQTLGGKFHLQLWRSLCEGSPHSTTSVVAATLVTGRCMPPVDSDRRGVGFCDGCSLWVGFVYRMVAAAGLQPTLFSTAASCHLCVVPVLCSTLAVGCSSRCQGGAGHLHRRVVARPPRSCGTATPTCALAVRWVTVAHVRKLRQTLMRLAVIAIC